MKRLYRSNSNKVFSGVCGGFGDYFNVDPVIVRLLWVVGTFVSAGLGFWGYVLASVIIPRIDEHGEEKRNSGCLAAACIALLAIVGLSAVMSIFGLVAIPFRAGAHFVSELGGVAFSGLGILLALIAFGIVLTVVVLLIVLIVRIAKK